MNQQQDGHVSLVGLQPSSGLAPGEPPKTVTFAQQAPIGDAAVNGAQAFTPPCIRWGVAEEQGRRRNMEDASVALGSLDEYVPQGIEAPSVSGVFAVFDGHNGPEAARFAAERILSNLATSSSFPGDMEEALCAAFLQLDHDYFEATRGSDFEAGTTALVAVVYGQLLTIANAGDSRAVLSRYGRAIDLTSDHKPHLPTERSRIEAVGGFVCAEGLLCGELGVARAIGDFSLAPGLKSLPGSPLSRSAVGTPTSRSLAGTPGSRSMTGTPAIRSAKASNDDEHAGEQVPLGRGGKAAAAATVVALQASSSGRAAAAVAAAAATLRLSGSGSSSFISRCSSLGVAMPSSPFAGRGVTSPFAAPGEDDSGPEPLELPPAAVDVPPAGGRFSTASDASAQEEPAPLPARPLLPGKSLTAGPLTAEPDTCQHILGPTDEFLILGCDGLFDVMPSQRAVEFVRGRLRDHNDPQRCADELVRAALDMHTSDNVTAIVVCFSPDPPAKRIYSSSLMKRSISKDAVTALAEALGQ